jgi:hypothetical protein
MLHAGKRITNNTQSLKFVMCILMNKPVLHFFEKLLLYYSSPDALRNNQKGETT